MSLTDETSYFKNTLDEFKRRDVQEIQIKLSKAQDITIFRTRWTKMDNKMVYCTKWKINDLKKKYGK